MLIDSDPSKPAPDAMRTHPTADDIRTAVENLGYDLKLREFAPRTEIGIRNFEERCEALATALSPPCARVAEPIARTKFYSILSTYIPSESIDSAWQELRESGLVP